MLVTHMMLVKLIMLAMLNIVVMVTGIRYVYHTRCVHYGDYDNCALVGKTWSYYFPSVS